jgi:hypothetical protein
MQETSRKSYHQLNQNKVLSERNKILKVFIDNPRGWFNDRELSEETHLPRNIVQSRRSDLIKKGKIKFISVFRDEITDRDVMYFGVKL